MQFIGFVPFSVSLLHQGPSARLLKNLIEDALFGQSDTLKHQQPLEKKWLRRPL